MYNYLYLLTGRVWCVYVCVQACVWATRAFVCLQVCKWNKTQTDACSHWGRTTCLYLQSRSHKHKNKHTHTHVHGADTLLFEHICCIFACSVPQHSPSGAWEWRIRSRCGSNQQSHVTPLSAWRTPPPLTSAKNRNRKWLKLGPHFHPQQGKTAISATCPTASSWRPTSCRTLTAWKARRRNPQKNVSSVEFLRLNYWERAEASSLLVSCGNYSFLFYTWNFIHFDDSCLFCVVSSWLIVLRDFRYNFQLNVNRS